MNLVLNLLYMTIQSSVPYLLITIGGVFVARAGVFNISMEGCCEFCAFAGIIFTYVTGNVFLGILSSLVMGILVNIVFYFFTVKFNGNLSVVGSGINLMALCIPPALLQALYGSRSNLIATQYIDTTKFKMSLPIIDKIPLISNVISGHTYITYLTVFIVWGLIVVMYKTKFGIYVRVTGENPDAAKSVGIKTDRIKLYCLIIAGLTSALAGLNISVEQLGMYTMGMSANRGFICLSAINCGRKEPGKACIYSLIFGFVRALQMVVNNFVPAAISSLLAIMPYVSIIVVLLVVEVPASRRNHLRFFKGN